jgi:hypothetical protein
MSASMESPVPSTVRQDLRRTMVNHYCQRLGLSADTAAFQRFRKTYDQLIDWQSKELLDSLAQADLRNRESKQRVRR